MKRKNQRNEGFIHELLQLQVYPFLIQVFYSASHSPLCVINRFMRISGSKLSYHLSVLKESGLIDGEYQGNWIIYSITDAGKKYV